jgi:ApaG protein
MGAYLTGIARRVERCLDGRWNFTSDEGVSNVTTQGIRVEVESKYVPQQSSPRDHHYVFAYTVRIANVGDAFAQLLARHWVITDADGHVEEVRGPGVVGQQPRLHPGDSFEYTSGCVLRTPRGTMHGTYEFSRANADRFDATIAPFELRLPLTLN